MKKLNVITTHINPDLILTKLIHIILISGIFIVNTIGKHGE
jgi:hypothetical protein